MLYTTFKFIIECITMRLIAIKKKISLPSTNVCIYEYKRKRKQVDRIEKARVRGSSQQIDQIELKQKQTESDMFN